MALTKADLVDQLIEKTVFNKQMAIEFVESFFRKMTGELVEGHDVKISGFGVFHVRNKKGRPGRNPKTGEVVEVSARNVVVFHPGRKLKNLINEQLNLEG